MALGLMLGSRAAWRTLMLTINFYEARQDAAVLRMDKLNRELPVE